MDAKQLRQLMPKNAQDAQSASELVTLPAAVLAPVVPDMLRQLKNLDSPVTGIFADFFAQHGESYAQEVQSFLYRSTMPEVKWVIVSRILPSWSADAVRQLHGSLGLLMSTTDFWGTDLWCIRLLAKHSLVERHSLEEWLRFKRKRLHALSQVAMEVTSELGLHGQASFRSSDARDPFPT